ncbi:MAG: acyl-CoA thioesterase II [Alphaproteobacteria bacterium]|jgi:acyl-CoA thioesterase-2|tara:strand:+ start:258 stop:1118 length:861 start_codon:yes stop_codon:yes gene_type:complete
MNERLENLINLLDIERIEENLFRGESPSDRWQRVFGGQVIGQALVAASRTVENRVCHSLHAYFLRAGDPKVPILYEVDRSRDGRSFTSRRVVAVQNGKKIFNMSASFQIEEDGLNHQDLMPDVDNFDDLPSEYDLRKKIINSVPDEYKDSFNKEWPVEVRPIDPVDLMNPEPKVPKNLIWFRAKSSLPDNVSLHQCVLAYMSDMSLLDTCTNPHGINFMSKNLRSASLDHAMWFHRPFKADEWLLYSQDSPSASGARGFNRGSIFDTSGNLIASVAQEGLIRVIKP